MLTIIPYILLCLGKEAVETKPESKLKTSAKEFGQALGSSTKNVLSKPYEAVKERVKNAKEDVKVMTEAVRQEKMKRATALEKAKIELQEATKPPTNPTKNE